MGTSEKEARSERGTVWRLRLQRWRILLLLGWTVVYFAGASVVLGAWLWGLGCCYGRSCRERALHRLVLDWNGRFLRKLGCEIHVEGGEHVPAGGVIIIANHQNTFDALLLIHALQRVPGFVAKREIFRIPGVAFWMRQIHCCSMDRRNVRADSAMLQRFSHQIKREGWVFVIFPEGTRNPTPQKGLLPFHQGSLRLATEAGVPVLPVCMYGSLHVGDPGGVHRVYVRISPLRITEGLAPTARQSFMRDVRTQIAADWEALQR